MSEIQFCQLKLDSKGKEKFKSLHNALFKNTAVSFEWIDWYLDLTKNTRIYGAFSGDMMVGMWCVEPRILVDLQAIRKVGRCFSVGVHPSYQRQGIFVKLSKFAIEQEKKIGEYDYILGFPQFGRNVIEGHYKAGWDFVQDIDIMSFRPNVVDEKSSLSLSTRDSFSSHISMGNFDVSSEFRSKRWLRHPDHYYICLSHGSAHVVVKPYGDSCHILDIEGRALEDIASMIEMTKTLAKRHNWKEINLWCAANSRIRNVVKSCGFVVGSERGSSVKLLSVKINEDLPLSFEECNFQMGTTEEMY